MQQITKLKWFPSRHAVAFAQSIESRCLVKNEDVVGAAPCKSGSPFLRVFACCLTAPSYYLNECWLVINEVLFTIHLRVIPEGITEYIMQWHAFQKFVSVIPTFINQWCCWWPGALAHISCLCIVWLWLFCAMLFCLCQLFPCVIMYTWVMLSFLDQWNLYTKTGKVLLKHKIIHSPGTVFTKSCLFSLPWKTTCLGRL